MTCIAAFRAADRIVIGGDSAGIAGLSLIVRADPKVFIRTDGAGEPWAFGFTTSFRMGDLLRYKLELPEVRPHGDLREFMVTRFIEATRTALSAGGWREKINEHEEGGCYLLGFRGELFQIDNDFQVGQLHDPYAAIGCGHHLALGAMHALHHCGRASIDPHETVLAALRAAERFSAGVRAPFNTVSIPAPATTA